MSGPWTHWWCAPALWLAEAMEKIGSWSPPIYRWYWNDPKPADRTLPGQEAK